MHLLVMPGEFIEVLTKGYLRGSLHRVMRPPPLSPRLSLPFLVRAKPKAVVNSKHHMDAARAKDPDGCGTCVLEEEGKTLQWLWDRHGGLMRHYTSS